MTLSKITALIQPPDKKGRVDVYADGEYIMSVSEDAALEAKLRVGMELNEKALLQVEHSIALSRAKNKAYNYLNYGDMSEQKLFQKLCRCGFDDGIAAECVGKMRDMGFVNDVRYAEALADSLANYKLYGPRRIMQELRQRGIDFETAQSALDGLKTDFSESIKALARGKLRRDMSSPREIQRLIAALIRYGHDYEMIKSSLSEMTDEEEIYE